MQNFKLGLFTCHPIMVFTKTIVHLKMTILHHHEIHNKKSTSRWLFMWLESYWFGIWYHSLYLLQSLFVLGGFVIVPRIMKWPCHSNIDFHYIAIFRTWSTILLRSWRTTTSTTTPSSPCKAAETWMGCHLDHHMFPFYRVVLFA
jgi:hypothetical protein